MLLNAKCPYCKKIVSYDHQRGGGNIQCVHCRSRIFVPAAMPPEYAASGSDTPELDTFLHNMEFQTADRMASTPPLGGIPVKGPQCQRCKQTTAERIVPNSYQGGFWSKNWKTYHLCPKCSQGICFVQDCQLPAAHVFYHAFSIGGGKHKVTIRNDLLLCETHHRRYSAAAKVLLKKFGLMAVCMLIPILAAVGMWRLDSSWKAILLTFGTLTILVLVGVEIAVRKFRLFPKISLANCKPIFVVGEKEICIPQLEVSA